MKVLYIIDCVTQGGATYSFLEMVSSLKRLGVIPIVCTGQYDWINDYMDKEGVENYVIGHKMVLKPLPITGWKGPLRFVKYATEFYGSEINALKVIRKKIDLHTIDLIHTNTARNDIGCFLNKKYGIRHIMHIREFGDKDFNCVSFRPNYIQIFNNFTTEFISISNAVKEHWVNKGIEKTKIVTIYNGVHYEDITISHDTDKINSFKMFIAGGVYPTKGQHLIVEAINFLPDNIRENVSVDIAGWYNQEYVNTMKEYAASRGYLKRIKFLGPCNDVHKRLGGYQVGLMCSRSEGFGRTTAEYMHAKLGVIASDSGANPELIEDGVTGLIFKSGDAKSLADCIVRLFEDRELLIRLSNAAQEKARKCYTQQKNAENIYNLYNEILNNK